MPGAYALAQPLEANRFANGKIGRQGNFHGAQILGKALADLQAHLAAGRKKGPGQRKALFLVNLAPEPAFYRALDAFFRLARSADNVPLRGGCRLRPRLAIGLGLFPALLAVEFAVNVFKNASGKGIIQNILEDILLCCRTGLG